TNAIRHLAFDAPGRLLASAADDQTVCVWSLTDLGDTLDKRCALRGVGVRADKEQLRIAFIDKDALEPANREALERAKAAEGDLITWIEGAKEGDRVRPLKTPQEFYEAVWLLGPEKAPLREKRVRLQLRDREGANPRRVELAVSQGTDERKPLFSL